ncbi:MAG: hypothetical protein WBG20_01710 [Candidatus Deferrimicrobiaceae bacterium]
MNRAALWILVFASATVFFGWKTYRALTGPVLPGEVPPAGAALSPPSAAAQPQKGPEDAAYSGLSSLLARPVFRPDRRPYQVGAAEGPQKNYEAELSRYTVLGVLMESDKMVALVVGKGGSKGERWEVGAGDSLSGFKVKEVNQDGLVLTADDREFTLPLYAGGPKAVGKAPLRTEVAPAPSAARAKSPSAARPTPGVTKAPPSAAAPPSTSRQGPSAAPTRIQQRRRYPRRYIPGRR